MKIRPYSWLVCAALLVGSTGVLGGAVPAWAAPPTIYRWVDSDGVAHFTTDLSRVPKALRKQASALSTAPETLEARKDLPTKSKPGPGSAAGESEFAERNVDFGASDSALAPDTGDALGTTHEASAAEPTPYRDTSAADSARIAELEQQIAQDEETIKGWLTEAGSDATQTQFEAAARRLPTLQRELAELRQQRSNAE